MNNPKISINIPCYNRSDMLRECIESFISQTYKNWELILIDDGSEEDLSFVTELDKRVKYFKQPHGGIAVGFNHALSRSSGKYIMPFGSDDLATSNELLEKEIFFLENCKEYDVVYCDSWILRKDGTRIRNKHIDISGMGQRELYRKMLRKQLISHGATLWRRNKIPAYDENVSPADDWDLFLTAVERNLRFYHIPERLWTYRVGHPRSSATQDMIDGCNRVLMKRGYKFNKKIRKGEKIYDKK